MKKRLDRRPLLRRLAGRVCVLGGLAVIEAVLLAGPASSIHAPAHPIIDQGLNPSEEQAFARALPDLLANPNVDMVLTLRQSPSPVNGCNEIGIVYWAYSARGTICFSRQVAGSGWSFNVQVVSGVNPVAAQDATALSTLAAERAASTNSVNNPEFRNLVDSGQITYPYVYDAWWRSSIPRGRAISRSCPAIPAIGEAEARTGIRALCSLGPPCCSPAAALGGRP